jgi:hypothetical protein
MNPTQELTQAEKRVKIAEACGWRYPGSMHLKTQAWNRWIPPKGAKGKVPDYFRDLNACHEMEKTLTEKQSIDYEDRLRHAVINKGEPHNADPWDFQVCHATAAQRAEAFGKTLGLW